MKNPLLYHLRFTTACLALALSAVVLHAQDAAPRPAPGSMRNDVPRISTPPRQWREPIAPSQSRAHRNDATEPTVVRSKFSDATKPGTLKVSLPWADLRVIGTDTPEIVITSTLAQKGKKEADPDGFRRLDDDVSFEIVEKDNVATVLMSGENPWASQGAEFNIQVPRNTRLVLRTEAGGDIKVENIDGDIDVNSMNGEVALTDISASAVVNTMNGEVIATFKQAPTKPVSITSMNGEVDVRLPADTKANLRLRTHNGSIRTNFPEGALVTKTEKLNGVRTRVAAPAAPAAPAPAGTPAAVAVAAAPEAPEPPTVDDEGEDEDKDLAALPAAERAGYEAARAAHVAMAQAARVAANYSRGMVLGKSIVGSLNGGGVDIQLSTMNGTITLRQAK